MLHMANLFKKVFAGASAMAVVAASMNVGAIVSAAGTISAEFDAAFLRGVENGVTTMPTQDAFAPFNAITREQAAKFAVNGLKAAGVELTLDPNADCSFADSASFDSSLVDSINEACGYGLIKGYGGKYHPTDVVTRGQWMTILGRALYGQQPEPAEYWTNYYALLKADGIFTIENAYNDVLRYEALLTLFRIAGDNNENVSDDDDLDSILCQLLGTCDDTTTEEETEEETTEEETEEEVYVPRTDLPLVEGGLNVTLSPATPVGGFVPNKASNVNVMKVDFYAGEDDIQLDAVTVKLEGFIARSNIQDVFFVNPEGVAMTNERSFTSDYTARAVFEKDFIVPANEVRSLYLYVETDSTSSNEVFNVAIMSAEDIEANTLDITGSFPIRSNTFQTTEYSSTVVTFDGEREDAETTPTEEVNVGETDQRVGRFELQVGNQNNRDIQLQNITLRSVDQLEGVLDNVRLSVGTNDNVAESVVIDGKYITFIISDDYVIEYGDNETFFIYADIIGGEANDVVQMYLDETTDISAFEVDTNAAVFVEIGGTNNSEDYLRAYKVIEGDSIISRRSDSPTSQFVPNDAEYETVLISNLYLSAAMDIDDFRVFAEGTAIASNFIDEVRLYVNGKQVDTTSTYVGTSPTGYYEFSLFETLQGSNEIVVAIDTTTNANAGTFKATVNKDSFAYGSNAEYVASKNTVPAGDISGVAVGGTMTIKTPAIQNVTRTDSYGATEKVVAGADDFELVKFAVQANAAGRDLIINSFSVDAKDSAGTAIVNGLASASVYVDGELVDTESFGSSTASFSSLGIVIPEGGTTEISILASIETSFTTDNPTGTLVVTVNDFDVDDSEGNTVDTTAVADTDSATFTVIESASLVSNINTDTPDEAIITAGTLYDVAEFEIEALDDNALIQELTFINVPMAFANNFAVAADATTAEKAADGATIYAFDTDGNELGSATLAEGIVYFSFATPVALERDNDGTAIILKAMPKDINDETDTNATMKFAMLNVGEVVAGTQRTFITSEANGEEITAVSSVGTNVFSETQYVRKSHLVISNIAEPTSTLLTNGIGKKIYEVSVATNNGEEALLKELRFDIELGGTAVISDFEFYDGNDRLDASEVTFVESNAACSVVPNGTAMDDGANCLSVVFAGNGYQIRSAKNFVLRAKVAGAVNGGDTISTRLSEVSNDATVDTYATINGEVASIVWSDQAADNTELTTVDWFTDAFVEVLPTEAWSFGATN